MHKSGAGFALLLCFRSRSPQSAFLPDSPDVPREHAPLIPELPLSEIFPIDRVTHFSDAPAGARPGGCAPRDGSAIELGEQRLVALKGIALLRIHSRPQAAALNESGNTALHPTCHTRHFGITGRRCRPSAGRRKKGRKRDLCMRITVAPYHRISVAMRDAQQTNTSQRQRLRRNCLKSFEVCAVQL